MDKDFEYSIQIFRLLSPCDTNKKDHFFAYRVEEEVDLGDTYGITVFSEFVADINGLKSYQSKSVYLVPKKQNFDIDSSINSIIAELIYQNLCRLSMVIYSASLGKIIIKIPTIKSILDNNNRTLN